IDPLGDKGKIMRVRTTEPTAKDDIKLLMKGRLEAIHLNKFALREIARRFFDGYFRIIQAYDIAAEPPKRLGVKACCTPDVEQPGGGLVKPECRQPSHHASC